MSYQRPLLSPNTPQHLPTGLQRGGVMEARWIPQTYNDAARAIVPTDSPYTNSVPQNIFREPTQFASPTQSRRITGLSGPGGMQNAHLQPNYPRPIGIPGYSTPQTPHGDQEGGIFGNQAVHSGMQVGPRVPQRRPMGMGNYLQGPGGVFGSGPDGLGG